MIESEGKDNDIAGLTGSLLATNLDSSAIGGTLVQSLYVQKRHDFIMVDWSMFLHVPLAKFFKYRLETSLSNLCSSLQIWSGQTK